MVDEVSLHVIHEADPLAGEWRGEMPCSYVRIVSGGVWGALERFSTHKDTSGRVVRVDKASEVGISGLG